MKCPRCGDVVRVPGACFDCQLAVSKDGLVDYTRLAGYRVCNLESELAEWRTGKRRVFWRVLVGYSEKEFGYRSDAKLDASLTKGSLMRVTVRPKGAKR